MLARNGVIGLGLYIALLVSLLRATYAATRRRQSDSQRALHFVAFLLIVCYLLYSMPFRPLSYTTSAWYMWMMLALSLGNTRVWQLQQAQARSQRRREAEEKTESPQDESDEDVEQGIRGFGR